jgi:hypothetical protein
MGATVCHLNKLCRWLRCRLSLGVDEIEISYRYEYDRFEYGTSNSFHSSLPSIGTLTGGYPGAGPWPRPAISRWQLYLFGCEV